MRDHIYRPHKSAAAIVKAFGGRDQKRRLEGIRRQGMWAFVSIPDEDDEGTCVIHFWHRKDQDPRAVALMMGHELGHIADGGPKDHEIGAGPEEDRADEFGRAAQEAVTYLAAMGMIIDSGGRRFDPRGPGPAGRVRRAAARPVSGSAAPRRDRRRGPRSRRG